MKINLIKLHINHHSFEKPLLPPANEVCEGYVFTGVCLSTQGGHAWLLGGHAWLLRGACMVARGGHAWLGGMHGFFQGVRGFSWGGLCGFLGGAACVVFPGGACIGYDEIRSMNGRYASYWNAFLFYLKFQLVHLANKLIINLPRSKIFSSWTRG